MRLKIGKVDNVPDFDPSKARRKWLSYFDLLAWSGFCGKADLSTIFEVYRHALKELNERGKGWPQIARAWASDTFLFYSTDDSPEAFQVIEHLSRWFEALMLNQEIPLRGALACGDFYADENSRLFFGKALVEAHQYAEGQNWIGFVLSPSAKRRASQLRLLPSSFYRSWPVSLKRTPETEETLQAFMLDSTPLSPRGGDILRALRRMERRVVRPDVRLMYTRTIEFLLGHQE